MRGIKGSQRRLGWAVLAAPWLAAPWLAAPWLAAPWLAACAPQAADPLQMPPVTSAQFPLTVDKVDYVVTRSALDAAQRTEVIRIYRAAPLDFGYDEGATAKHVAEAFCARWNRALSPLAQGRFEPVGAWAFVGGCA